MWFAFVLWLWRGGDSVSIQPTEMPAHIVTVRTIQDVEHDLLTARQAQRRGPARRYPDEITRFDKAVNDYLDEWVWHHAGGPTLDWAIDDKADEQATVINTGSTT